MRRLEDIANVLMPTLDGVFFFGILGANGYNAAVLARSERGLVHGARRLIFNGEGNIEFGPARIRIVAPPASAIEEVRAEHARRVRVSRVSAVTDRVCRYYELIGSLPHGFTITRSEASDTFSVRPKRGKAKRARWTGSGDVTERFSVPVEERWSWSDSSGTPSAAGPSIGDLFVAYRGWRGGVGSKASAGYFYADELLREEPAFFFNVIEKLPTLLDETIQQYHEHEAAEKVRHAAGMAKIAADREAYYVREREELLQLFGPPEVKP